MRLIEYSDENDFTKIINLDQITAVNFHPNHPNVADKQVRLHFRFAGDKEGVSIYGDEAKRVWELVQGLTHEEEREEIITDVMEIIYEVFGDARDRMKALSRRQPLVAATKTPSILLESLNSIFSQMYPDASHQLDKRIMEARGVSIDEDEEENEAETDGE